ncbi:hypothetical protein G9A89_013591 [Geosiphon pyriformis]|nr:hypothetical protein G9A89_013591 [Geosiphon pyriformis]
MPTFKTSQRLYVLSSSLTRPHRRFLTNYSQNFSTVSATKTSRFLSSPKLKSYLPFVYRYLHWSILSTLSLHLVWTKKEYADYREKIMVKIVDLEQTIASLQGGPEEKKAPELVLETPLKPVTTPAQTNPKMMKYINQVTIKFSPFAKGARTNRVFLSYIMTDEQREDNPKAKIITTVLSDLNAQPSISITFRDGKKFNFATDTFKIDSLMMVIKKHIRKLQEEESNS